MAREAEIKIVVELDEKNRPLSLKWQATDAPEPGAKPCDAVLLSFWDPKSRNTLSFDLWTSQMTIDEMNFLVLERLYKLAETHRKATNSVEIHQMLAGFCRELTEKLEAAARDRLG